ncbi:MAG: NAD-dependent epimerase/dehydratase family protein [Anaerolineae bacterium]
MAWSIPRCGQRNSFGRASGRCVCPVCGGPLQVETTDEAQVRPHNQYAMSKYTQEMIALNLGQRYGIPTTAMRYSITQGPRQSFRNAYSGICRIFVTRMLAGQAPDCLRGWRATARLRLCGRRGTGQRAGAGGPARRLSGLQRGRRRGHQRAGIRRR